MSSFAERTVQMSTSTPSRSGHLSAEENEIVEHVSLADLRRHLAWFARRGLRLGGTGAERDAAVYIREQLRAMGSECALEDFDAYVSYAAEPESIGLARVSVEGSAAESYSGKIYAFSASTGAAGRDGALVYVGKGSPSE